MKETIYLNFSDIYVFMYLRIYVFMYFHSNKHSSLYTTVNTIKCDIREIVLCIEFY